MQVKSDLALPAEQLPVHCMAVLCPSRIHEGRQKTNTLSKQITPLHLLLLLKGERKERPACEPVLVMFLTASLPEEDLAKRIAQLILQLLYSELKQSEIFGERVLKHLQGRRAMGRTLPSSALRLF